MSHNTLSYLRIATAARDGSDGLLYHHSWPTGYQELVFRDAAHAKRWLASANDASACAMQASDSYAPNAAGAEG